MSVAVSTVSSSNSGDSLFFIFISGTFVACNDAKIHIFCLQPSCKSEKLGFEPYSLLR